MLLQRASVSFCETRAAPTPTRLATAKLNTADNTLTCTVNAHTRMELALVATAASLSLALVSFGRRRQQQRATSWIGKCPTIRLFLTQFNLRKLPLLSLGHTATGCCRWRKRNRTEARLRIHGPIHCDSLPLQLLFRWMAYKPTCASKFVSYSPHSVESN